MWQPNTAVYTPVLVAWRLDVQDFLGLLVLFASFSWILTGRAGLLLHQWSVGEMTRDGPSGRLPNHKSVANSGQAGESVTSRPAARLAWTDLGHDPQKKAVSRRIATEFIPDRMLSSLFSW